MKWLSVSSPACQAVCLRLLALNRSKISIQFHSLNRKDNNSDDDQARSSMPKCKNKHCMNYLSIFFSRLQSRWSVRSVLLILVADTQLYKILCPSISPLVHWSVTLEFKTWKTSIYDADFFYRCMKCMGGAWGVGSVKLGVGCPFPPVRNYIVIPCHLLFHF